MYKYLHHLRKGRSNTCPGFGSLFPLNIFLNAMIKCFLYHISIDITYISNIITRYSFRNLSKRKRYRSINEDDLVDLDIGQPHLWYAKARGISRKVICHVGPTNSGTFQIVCWDQNPTMRRFIHDIIFM